MNKIGKIRLIILFAVHDGSLAGKPPTRRDLVRLTGTHINNVWKHLVVLEKAGLIRQETLESGRGSARSLWPTFRFIPYEKLEEEHAVRDGRGR